MVLQAPLSKQSDFLYAKKHLGQNFLVDRNVLMEIVEHSEVSPEDILLEVGPGQGVLTKELLQKGCKKLYAVELDHRMRPFLEKLESLYPALHITWGDAMTADYNVFSPFPNKVVANIPYNITTPLIWKLLPFASLGLTYHLYMVQKEAAERLLARADTKERYPLGVTLEVMGSVTLIRKVPPTCFRPIPRVDSAVVEIILDRNLDLTQDSLWSDLLHAAFRQRRKTLMNNLKNFNDVTPWGDILKRVAIDPRNRAEDLTGDEWLNFYRLWRAEIR